MATQAQSAFFSLPGEVRNMIYGYLVPSIMHLVLKQGKFYTYPCNKEAGAGGVSRASGVSRERRVRYFWPWHRYCKNSAQLRATMPLLFLCKKTFQEFSAEIISSRVVVVISDYATLRHVVRGYHDRPRRVDGSGQPPTPLGLGQLLEESIDINTMTIQDGFKDDYLDDMLDAMQWHEQSRGEQNVQIGSEEEVNN